MKGKFLLLSIGLAGLLLALALGLLAGNGPARAAGGETFTVDSTADASDAAPGDCQCRTSGDVCTLRAAIEEANTCSGAQTIRFGGPWLIAPTTALPAITDNETVIDGSEWWMVGGGLGGYPAVWLDGEGRAFSGLRITASNCAVYGLVIKSFGYHGVHLYGGAQGNHIGGTGFHQRLVISANGQNGVRIEGTTTTGNVVEGCYVGSNPEGTAEPFGSTDWSNHWHGINIWYANGNTISYNLVADNDWSGVAVDGVDGSTAIHDNRMGLAIDGQPLGNGFYGIHLAHGSAPDLFSNTIAFNSRGIYVEGGSNPHVHHNTIYSNTALPLTYRNGGGILVTGSGTRATIEANDILSNTGRFGGGVSVENNAHATIVSNTIRANRAYTSTGNWVGGGGIYVYWASANIQYNDILSNTATGVLPAQGGGVALESVTTVTLEGNRIQNNTVVENAGGGGGIYVGEGDDVQILRNWIVGNTVQTWSHAGGAIEINNDPATSHALVEGNWVAYNSVLFGGAILVLYSDRITLTNNVIVRNFGHGVYLEYSMDDHIVAYNNTIAHNRGSGLYLHDASLKLDNTVVVSNTDYGLYLSGVWSLTHWRNDVWGNGLGNCNVSPCEFYIQQDPLFFDPAADVYALQLGSPCIDVGNARVSTSYNGLPRPQGTGHDLGAYEMAAPTYLPLVLRND